MFKFMHQNRKAQSFLEYTITVMVIAAALIAMYEYMQRSINGRLKSVQTELEETRR